MIYIDDVLFCFEGDCDRKSLLLIAFIDPCKIYGMRAGWNVKVSVTTSAKTRYLM